MKLGEYKESVMKVFSEVNWKFVLRGVLVVVLGLAFLPIWIFVGALIGAVFGCSELSEWLWKDVHMGGYTKRAGVEITTSLGLMFALLLTIAVVVSIVASRVLGAI